MADKTYYKLILDDDADQDLIKWLGTIGKNRKAEVVRHALRYYISQLKEGETFIMPFSTVQQGTTAAPKPEMKPGIRPGVREMPSASILGIKNSADD